MYLFGCNLLYYLGMVIINIQHYRIMSYYINYKRNVRHLRCLEFRVLHLKLRVDFRRAYPTIHQKTKESSSWAWAEWFVLYYIHIQQLGSYFGKCSSSATIIGWECWVRGLQYSPSFWNQDEPSSPNYRRRHKQSPEFGIEKHTKHMQNHKIRIHECSQ